MDHSAARYLQALTAEVSAVVGGRLVGVYPHGSLMLGGYLATRSDIDVLVVVEDPLSPDEQADLAARLSEDALPCPAVGLELSVVLRSVAATPTARPAFELHVTTAPQDRKVVDGHGHPGDLDLVLHFAVCHALGYAPFAEVPPSLVLAQVADELAWAAEHNPSEYALLNACRAWRYAVDGSLVSKVDGGRWAETRLDGPELTLVREALARQSGEELPALDPDAVRTFARRLRHEVEVIMRSRRDWSTRPESSADRAAIRALTVAAFSTADEADLVDALRADDAWINGLSMVATTPDGVVVGHALLTRCWVDHEPALCLAPCSVLPGYQRRGAGSAAIQAVLAAARTMGESFVIVLGHPDYYPRFGFRRASLAGIQLSIDVPDEALMALTLDPERTLPRGTVRYAAPFGI